MGVKIKMEIKDYFEGIYTNTIDSANDTCESIKCGYTDEDEMYWLESDFGCLGIYERFGAKIPRIGQSSKIGFKGNYSGQHYKCTE